MSASSYRWLGLALLLFLLQTLPFLSHRWVTDESWYAGPGSSIAQGHGIADPAIGPNDLENHFDARPPGTALVIAAAFRLFGVNQISARLGSILAGLIIIVLVYRLARSVMGEQGALLAVFLIATDNLIVLTSRAARPEALTVMMILAALLAMKCYAGKGSLHWAVVSGLLMALGTMFHVTLLGYIVSIGILMLVSDRGRGVFPLRGAIGYALGYGVGLIPYAVWIVGSPMGAAGFREEFLSRAGSSSLGLRLLAEGHRYSDLLGLHLLHGHGLESLPVRLPIPLFFLVASYLLFKLRRQWFYLELALLLPTAFWLVYTVNKSSRYLALLAPIFALVMAAAVAAAADKSKLQRALFAIACLVIGAQLAANLYLLNGARHADYNRVGAELRSVIPQGQTAYGTITFWLALHDRSFISYERTDPWMAAHQFHARYFITGDRMMENGMPTDDSFYQDLHRHMDEIIAQSRQVGEFPDPYYGDLKVYQLREP
jgi:4-amino-4-deoxy-L-arabinose transferase-like glycosyltransferase